MLFTKKCPLCNKSRVNPATDPIIFTKTSEGYAEVVICDKCADDLERKISSVDESDEYFETENFETEEL